MLPCNTHISLQVKRFISQLKGNASLTRDSALSQTKITARGSKQKHFPHWVHLYCPIILARIPTRLQADWRLQSVVTLMRIAKLALSATLLCDQVKDPSQRGTEDPGILEWKKYTYLPNGTTPDWIHVFASFNSPTYWQWAWLQVPSESLLFFSISLLVSPLVFKDADFVGKFEIPCRIRCTVNLGHQVNTISHYNHNSTWETSIIVMLFRLYFVFRGIEMWSIINFSHATVWNNALPGKKHGTKTTTWTWKVFQKSQKSISLVSNDM